MATAFVDRIYRDIESQIRTGRLPEHQRIPSLEEIGSQYGASQGAVRYAIRKLVRDGLVYPVPGKGTFVGSARRQMAPAPLLPVGMIIVGDEYQLDPRVRGIMRGIDREATYRGHAVLYNEVAERQPALLASRLKMLKDRGVEGVVHVGEATAPLAKIFVESGVRTVLTGDLILCDHLVDWLDTVTNNRYAEAILAIDQLAALGHRRIGYITSCDDQGWGKITRDGMNNALHSHGMVLDAQYDLQYPLMHRRVAYRAGVELGQSLAQKIDALPTAFFCADDMIALGLVDGLLESGIDVPGQISACTSTMVIWPDVIARGQYTLSGISVPWEVIGNVAVQRLLAQKTPGTGIGRHTVTGSWLAGTTVGPASAART